MSSDAWDAQGGVWQADVLVHAALATVAWRGVLLRMGLHKGGMMDRLWCVV